MKTYLFADGSILAAEEAAMDRTPSSDGEGGGSEGDDHFTVGKLD